MAGRAGAVVNGKAARELGPGQLLFRRGMVHGFPEILEAPVVAFSVDRPRRDPKDVIFVDRESGTAESFIRTVKEY